MGPHSLQLSYRRFTHTHTHTHTHSLSHTPHARCLFHTKSLSLTLKLPVGSQYIKVITRYNLVKKWALAQRIWSDPPQKQRQKKKMLLLFPWLSFSSHFGAKLKRFIENNKAVQNILSFLRIKESPNCRRRWLKCCKSIGSNFRPYPALLLMKLNTFTFFKWGWGIIVNFAQFHLEASVILSPN